MHGPTPKRITDARSSVTSWRATAVCVAVMTLHPSSLRLNRYTINSIFIQRSIQSLGLLKVLYTSPSGRPYTSPPGRPYTSPSGRPYTSPPGRPYTSPSGRPYTSSSGRPYTSSSGRPVHSNTNFTSLRCIYPHCNYCAMTIRSQVLIYTAE